MSTEDFLDPDGRDTRGRLELPPESAARHYCERPPIRTWDDDAEDVFATVRHLPVGTRYFCACGKVWIVVWIPDQISQHMVTVAHHEWREESRRERRQRLGLRWWQRG